LSRITAVWRVPASRFPASLQLFAPGRESGFKLSAKNPGRFFMKKLIPVLVIFTLVFLSGCGMLLDNIAGEKFDPDWQEDGGDSGSGGDGGGSNNSGGGSNSSGGNTPAKVTGVNAIPVSGGILVSWTAVSGAASYTVYRAFSSSSSYTVISPNITNTWYKDTDGTGTARYYVRAVNSVGEGPGSGSDSVTAGTTTVTPLRTPSSSTSWPKYELSSGVPAQYYRFQSFSSGNTTIRWADSDESTNFRQPLTADIKVSAYYEDTGEAIFTGKDDGYDPGQILSGRGGRYIIVKVEPLRSSDYGSFVLKYE
jgi:hypothetical protein